MRGRMENYYKPLTTGEMDISAKMSHVQRAQLKLTELSVYFNSKRTVFNTPKIQLHMEKQRCRSKFK